MKCTPVLFYSLPEELTRDQNIAIILAGGTWTLLHLIHVLDKGDGDLKRERRRQV